MRGEQSVVSGRRKEKERNLAGRARSQLKESCASGRLAQSKSQGLGDLPPRPPFLSSRVCCLEKYGSGIGVNCCPSSTGRWRK